MRSIDHFVLVSASLADARARYRRMGFTVAPDGVHPFGTYNANMYFRDGPMIETLAIENPARYAEAVAAGNSFVANDAAFRAARGDEGFSHVVVTSRDAERDHAAFLDRGVSGGKLVSFSRDFELPDGRMERVEAKLAFATPAGARCGFFFTCEDIVVPAIDRSSLLDHGNGALGARQALSCAQEPLAYADFLKGLVEPNEVHVGAQRVDCVFPNGRASIVTPELLAGDFGLEESPDAAGLQHRALLFQVKDLGKTERLFARNGLPFTRHKERLVARTGREPAPVFVFEQRR